MATNPVNMGTVAVFLFAAIVMNSYFVLRSNVLCNTSVNSVLHKYHKLVFTAIKLFHKSIILSEFL